MKTYQRGESIFITIETRTLAGVLTNLSTGATVTIYDPTRTVVAGPTSMTTDETGKYYLAVTSAATWMRGIYLARVIATDTSGVVYVDENFFLEVITDAT